MVNKKWVLLPIPDTEKTETLSKQLNINPILSDLLIQRGYDTFEKAKAFFRPSLKTLHDPFEMADMDNAVMRLGQAIEKNEKILVYGDYDVDGTTSVAMVYDFLKKQRADCDFYIPDRYSEGYGVSEKGLSYAIDNEFDVVISLDCGIRANNLISIAKENNIDFIVCDHHTPGEDLPPAFAILDPKRPDCSYPYKELSGCGVGFKLLQGYCIQNQLEPDDLLEYLDLVAVSIGADIVPLTGENRIFAFYGLRILNESPRAGLQALIEISGILGDVDINGIVFGLGPRINAAGRIGHARDAVRLLLSDDLQEAQHFAKKVNDKNDIRRDVDKQITNEALEMIAKNDRLLKSRSTVLFKNDWHKGVIGIVASRCMEKYYRPTIILTESNNVATGSARSVYGFDVHEAISKCSDLLLQFGGHTYAAGLSLPVENVPAFQQRFEDVVSSTIRKEQLQPQLLIDHKLNFDTIHPKFYNIIHQMGPFGPLNLQPLFLSTEVSFSEQPQVIKDIHLKMKFKQEGNRNIFEGIGFGLADLHEELKNGQKFDIVYQITLNNFQGYDLQLNIKDIKAHS